MSDDTGDRVEQMRRPAIEHYLGQTEEGREPAQAGPPVAKDREWATKQRQRSLVEQVHRDAIEQHHVQPPILHERTTVPYTELPEGRADSPIAREWNLYRREVARLLAEGHENRWVLIKGDEIVGIWDTEEDARAAALQKYLMQPCLIQQVRSHEPIVRMSARFWRCQS